jgi:hypothetical protein
MIARSTSRVSAALDPRADETFNAEPGDLQKAAVIPLVEEDKEETERRGAAM